MTVTKFESYLQKGLGRAILFLREEPDKEPFRASVWNHAISDPRYDRQCNAPRGQYIKNLFDCFPDGDTMLSELFRIYGEDRGNPDDRWYYIENLGELIEEKIEGAAAALDNLYCVLFETLLSSPNPLTYGRDRERDDYFYAARTRYRNHLADLGDLVRDGIALLQKSTRYDITSFIDFFKEEIRVSESKEFTAICTALEKEDPAYQAIFESYRTEAQEQQTRLEKAQEDFHKPTNWREAIDYAIKKGNPRIPVNESLWQNLSQEDQAEIARLAEVETDPERRCALLSQLSCYGVWLLRCYPRDPSPLIAELERNIHITFPVMPEKYVIKQLAEMVSRMRHPAVREFALRAISGYKNNPDSIIYSCAIKTWAINYLPEDADLLEEFVKSIRDKDLLHRVGSAFIALESSFPESVLLYLYENTPCSNCRSWMFLYLMARYGDMTNLPEPIASIRREAKLDCDYGTRMQARAKSIGIGASE